MSEQDAAEKQAEEILSKKLTGLYDAGRELIAAALRAKDEELESARADFDKYTTVTGPHRYWQDRAGAMQAERDELRKQLDVARAALSQAEDLTDSLECDLALVKNEQAAERLTCGHRKMDWGDSYGDCALCPMLEMARDYDRLPHDVIAAHDKIEQLEAAAEQAAERQRALENAIVILTKHDGWDLMMNDAEYRLVKEVKTKYTILAQDVKP